MFDKIKDIIPADILPAGFFNTGGPVPSENYQSEHRAHPKKSGSIAGSLNFASLARSEADEIDQPSGHKRTKSKKRSSISSQKKLKMGSMRSQSKPKDLRGRSNSAAAHEIFSQSA